RAPNQSRGARPAPATRLASEKTAAIPSVLRSTARGQPFTAWVRSTYQTLRRQQDALQAAGEIDLAHRMPHGAQARSQLMQRSPFLQLGKAIAATAIGQVYRLLQAQLPIQYPQQSLGNVVDNRRPARRAYRQIRPVTLEHQYGRHGTARPF